MGTLGPAEILVILLVALIVLGPERLPEAARKMGQVIGEIRKIGAGFQAELRDAMNTAAMPGNPETTASTTSAAPTPAPGAPPGPAPDIEVAPPPPSRPDGTGDELP